MNLRSALSKDPKRLIQVYITGSLIVLLIGLGAPITLLSTIFATKERDRAQLSLTQLRNNIAFQYRLISEEMWTESYESIGMRISEIAKQIGGADFDLFLADPSGACVFSTGSKVPSTRTCKIPGHLASRISSFTARQEREQSLTVDSKSNNYIFVAPLYVGSTHKGFLFALFSDPFDFFSGDALALSVKFFLPTLGVVLLFWFFWLQVSRTLFLRPYLAGLIDLRKREALANLAAQVAHDIRSPLTALDMIRGDISELPEDKRLMLKIAVDRIRDIANNLLASGKEGTQRSPSQDASKPLILVGSLVDQIITEKRLEFRALLGIRIEFIMTPASFGLFAAVQAIEFARALSNLITNSVEACEGGGTITVRLDATTENAVITIIDNGRGIPANVLPLLTTKGQTFGKPSGNGLGLFHARKTIEEAKGSFEINSVEGSGTQVMLKLPRSSPPVWFKSEIRLDGHSTLVSVDDDVSIHEIWSRRLQELKAHCPELLRFSTSKELGSWLKNHPGANKSTIFLIDYELIGQKEDGVELITRLGLIDRSILVTSRFEEPQLQDRCIKIGLRILPKFLSQYVPIVVDHGL